jgi:hypothetical protein
METIAVFMFASVAFYGMVLLVRHFFPNWEQSQEDKISNYAHERITDLEGEIADLASKFGLKRSYDIFTGETTFVPSATQNPTKSASSDLTSGQPS